MTTALRSIVVALPLALALSGCPPPPNFLEGSIDQSHDLTFDRVELRFLADQKVYQLSYFNSLDEENPGGDADTVAKITFNEPAGGVKVDEAINLLAAEIEGRVERVTAADDPFPPDLEKADVTFHTAATVGEVCTGEFAITWTNGKTLFGTFEATLESVSF